MCGKAIVLKELDLRVREGPFAAYDKLPNAFFCSNDDEYIIYEYGDFQNRSFFTFPITPSDKTLDILPFTNRPQFDDTQGMDMNSMHHKLKADIRKGRLVLWHKPKCFFIYTLEKDQNDPTRYWKYVNQVQIGSMEEYVHQLLTFDPTFDFFYTIKLNSKTVTTAYFEGDVPTKTILTATPITPKRKSYGKIYSVGGKIKHVEHSPKSGHLAIHSTAMESACGSIYHRLDILDVSNVDSNRVICPQSASICRTHLFHCDHLEFTFLPDGKILVFTKSWHSSDLKTNIYDDQTFDLLKPINIPFTSLHQGIYSLRVVKMMRTFQIGQRVWVCIFTCTLANEILFFALGDNHMVRFRCVPKITRSLLSEDGQFFVFSEHRFGSRIQRDNPNSFVFHEDGSKISRIESPLAKPTKSDLFQAILYKSPKKQLPTHLKRAVILCIFE